MSLQNFLLVSLGQKILTECHSYRQSKEKKSAMKLHDELQKINEVCWRVVRRLEGHKNSTTFIAFQEEMLIVSKNNHKQAGGTIFLDPTPKTATALI